MTKIAHLTDLHLLEDDHAERTGFDALRLSYLSFGRPRSAERRRLRALQALEAARDAGADHVVVTGDLTEDGTDAQFQVLARVLRDSGVPPSRVTLVPGNHDMYADEGAWDRALSGPLARYRATSAPGGVIHLPGVVVVAVSTAFRQHFTLARGRVDPTQVDLVRRVAVEARRSGRAVVVAQHHPPLAHGVPLVHWIEGLVDHEPLLRVLEAHDHVTVLHGHTHEQADRPVRVGGVRRVFSARPTATGVGLRCYRLAHRRLWPEPVELASAGYGLATA